MTIINSQITAGGIQPSGTKSITTNGTHDVTNYANADVQVPTTAPAYYIEFTKDANDVAQMGSHLMDFSDFTSVSTNAFNAAFYANTNITGTVNMSNITTLPNNSACASMFGQCTGITSVDLSGLTSISGASACNNMFSYCSGITSVDLSNLYEIAYSGSYACQYMFSQCTGLTTVNVSSLFSIASANACNNMFETCTNLTSVDLSGLRAIGGYGACSNMFRFCTRLATIDLSSLKTVNGQSAMSYMFNGARALTHMDFCSLSTIPAPQVFSYAFNGCTTLNRLSFYALTPTSFGGNTNQFVGMLGGCSNVTVHFPIAIQATIGSWVDVTNGFGGTGTTVLFDIVTSLTGADSNTYTRSQKNSTSTATAWECNDVLYYTAGTTEPSVNDSIFSDASCTTTETTISAIA